ncbi:hypothetical protein K2173_025999 [Erythroxylum novogranatense]|uniref:Uncharacterized protein n=1 Tax=Erythroxylum novogranatense TaxID=1862640 RepID=A0AAV8TZ94_9ROSI|nr:hypothetical protein K2173_025999 [Erythroxylum novogranatense]
MILLNCGKEKMAVSLNRFSRWLWSSKEKESVSNGSSLNSSTDLGFGSRELDSVKFPRKSLASYKKVKRKSQSREQRKIDKKSGDVVLVSSDGGVYVPESESNDPDWSIGWVEPHGPEFRRDNENDDGFAVLVPCYRPSCKHLVDGSKNQLLTAINSLRNEFSSEGKNCMEWLSSLQS